MTPRSAHAGNRRVADRAHSPFRSRLATVRFLRGRVWTRELREWLTSSSTCAFDGRKHYSQEERRSTCLASSARSKSSSTEISMGASPAEALLRGAVEVEGPAGGRLVTGAFGTTGFGTPTLERFALAGEAALPLSSATVAVGVARTQSFFCSIQRW